MFRIAGIVADGRPEDIKVRLGSMLDSMVHEPSDVLHVCSIPELRCYVGWISGKDSKSDIDSLILRRPDRLLVFSGEHFDDLGPIAESASHRASAAALLHTDGGKREDILHEMNGWFAGVLVDVAAQSIVLFNDRFGLRRLYYSLSDGGFAFASEAKALLAIQPDGPRWHSEALAEQLAYGCVLNDKTLFQDVFVLPPGSAWSIHNPGRARRRQYFSADAWENQAVLPDEEFYWRLKETLVRVLPRYVSWGPSVGVSLTGGLDSRIIMAFMGDAGAHPASYTYGGMYRDCYDVEIAAEVARVCGCHHEVLRLGPQFLRDFGTYAEDTIWLTDGTLDVGAAHEVYLSGLARRISPVRVTGNYGSEILRDVTTFKPLGLSADLFEPRFKQQATEVARTIDAVKQAHPVSFAAFKELPWRLFGRLNAGQSQLTPRSPYTDNRLVALAYQASPAVRTSASFWTRLIADRNPRLASIPTDRGHVAGASPLATFPSRLYNYMLFKAEWYYESGMPHWLAGIDKRVSRGGSPPFFVGAHKIENYRMWFREPVSEYLDAVLSDSSCASVPWVQWDRCQAMLAAHRDGRKNFVKEITSLTTVALIQKLLVGRRRRAVARPHAIDVELGNVTD
jgi:asparagine synthase (glutamine-hydrolysing)